MALAAFTRLVATSAPGVCALGPTELSGTSGCVSAHGVLVVFMVVRGTLWWKMVLLCVRGLKEY